MVGQLCRHVVAADAVDELLAVQYRSKKVNRADVDALLVMQARESNAITSLMRSLRLNPSKSISRRERQTATVNDAGSAVESSTLGTQTGEAVNMRDKLKAAVARNNQLFALLPHLDELDDPDESQLADIELIAAEILAHTDRMQAILDEADASPQ